MPAYLFNQKVYNKAILKNTGIKVDFEDFKDTTVHERYIVNAAQFAGAKVYTERNVMQQLLFDSDGNKLSLNEFKRKAESILEQFNNQWTNVEYDTASRNAVMGEKFRSEFSDRDLYPYWRYVTAGDDKVREDHAELNGLVFRYGEADELYPPNDWNCRCTAEQISEDEVTGEISNADDWRDNVNEDFRRSPIDGVLPSTGSYFHNFDISNISSKSFGLDDLLGLEDFSSQLQLVELVNEWRKKYHVNKKGELVFQNKELLINVTFNDNMIHKLRNENGVEHIPYIIEQADEVWALWGRKNKTTVLTYIKKVKGRLFYLRTLNCSVVGFGGGDVNKLRRGVPCKI